MDLVYLRKDYIFICVSKRVFREKWEEEKKLKEKKKESLNRGILFIIAKNYAFIFAEILNYNWFISISFYFIPLFFLQKIYYYYIIKKIFGTLLLKMMLIIRVWKV